MPAKCSILRDNPEAGMENRLTSHAATQGAKASATVKACSSFLMPESRRLIPHLFGRRCSSAYVLCVEQTSTLPRTQRAVILH